MNDFFEIYIPVRKYDNLYNDLLLDIEINFSNNKSKNYRLSRGYYCLLREDFKRFIDRYISNKNIRWDLLIQNQDLPWEHDILTKYNYLWNWSYIIRNSAIKWSTDFILKNVEYIHFGELVDLIDFEWSVENIEILKKWIHFTNIGVDRDNWQTPINYDYLQFFLNKNYLKYGRVNNSISFSYKVNWTNHLIESFCDYWDWNELSANKTVCWDAELISKYEDKVNFDLLSLNDGVKWSVDLIDKFKDKWNWIYMSGNTGIPWSNDLIIKYENMLVFGKEQIDPYSLNLIDVYTLSGNSSIVWDIELFDRYINKLDVWEISINCNIIENVLIKYYQYFNETRSCGSIFFKYSDWRNEFEILRNCWQNLVLNPFINVDYLNNSFFEEHSFLFYFPNGNLAHDGEVETVTITIKELFNNKEKYILKKGRY